LIDQQLLEILRCPHDHSSLQIADARLVQRINQGISAGQIKNLGGQIIKRQLDSGLLREAGDLLYPVVDEIPVMLPDEAIETAQLD